LTINACRSEFPAHASGFVGSTFLSECRNTLKVSPAESFEDHRADQQPGFPYGWRDLLKNGIADLCA
jgi:hypothetical protein